MVWSKAPCMYSKATVWFPYTTCYSEYSIQWNTFTQKVTARHDPSENRERSPCVLHGRNSCELFAYIHQQLLSSEMLSGTRNNLSKVHFQEVLLFIYSHGILTMLEPYLLVLVDVFFHFFFIFLPLCLHTSP